MIHLPLEVHSFPELVKKEDNNFYYKFVDKTHLIPDVLKHSSFTLLLSPPQSGKTLFLSTLECFLSDKVNQMETKGFFDELSIKNSDASFFQEHQGKYVVLSISFQKVKSHTFEGILNDIRKTILSLYEAHAYLGDSENGFVKKDYEQMLGHLKSEQMGSIKLSTSLKELTKLLYVHHKKRIIILFDDYDVPIRNALNKGDLKLLQKLSQDCGFLDNLYGYLLKNNSCIQNCVLTGVVPYILPRFGNVRIQSFENLRFTEKEVVTLLKSCGKEQQLKSIQKYYGNNNESIHDVTTYSPWAINNYIENNDQYTHLSLKRKDYRWITRSLPDFFNFRSDLNDDLWDNNERVPDFDKLMLGKTIEVVVSFSFRLEEEIRTSVAWGLLVYFGLITVVEKKPRGLSFECKLVITNEEAYEFFKGLIPPKLKINILSSEKNKDIYFRFHDQSIVTPSPEFFKALMPQNTLEKHSISPKPEVTSKDNFSQKTRSSIFPPKQNPNTNNKNDVSKKELSSGKCIVL